MRKNERRLFFKFLGGKLYAIDRKLSSFKTLDPFFFLAKARCKGALPKGRPIGIGPKEFEDKTVVFAYKRKALPAAPKVAKRLGESLVHFLIPRRNFQVSIGNN